MIYFFYVIFRTKYSKEVILSISISVLKVVGDMDGIVSDRVKIKPIIFISFTVCLTDKV